MQIILPLIPFIKINFFLTLSFSFPHHYQLQFVLFNFLFLTIYKKIFYIFYILLPNLTIIVLSIFLLLEFYSFIIFIILNFNLVFSLINFPVSFSLMLYL